MQKTAAKTGETMEWGSQQFSYREWGVGCKAAQQKTLGGPQATVHGGHGLRLQEPTVQLTSACDHGQL